MENRLEPIIKTPSTPSFIAIESESQISFCCQLRILNYELIYDLLSQLESNTKSTGDEEKSLLFIVRMAKKEVKKYKRESSQTAKNKGLRIVLFNIINDLTIHIRIYFSNSVPPD